MCARVPVEDVCCERAQFWGDFGFVTPRGTLSVSTYVDNVYVAGKSCYAASFILDDVGNFLSSRWGLCFKPDSCMIMPPLGSEDIDVTDDSKWTVVSEMEVLGHRLQCDSGIEACFRRTCENAWKAFFANCASRDANRLSVSCRISLLRRAVEPVVRFRWTRWPFRKDHANQLVRIQRKMLAILSGLRPFVGEPPDHFTQRRGREVSKLQSRMGSWGTKWAMALLSWNSHLERPLNSRSWASMLLELHRPAELADRRSRNNGRPCTRKDPGFIQRRWSESLTFAEDWISEHSALIST